MYSFRFLIFFFFFLKFWPFAVSLTWDTMGVKLLKNAAPCSNPFWVFLNFSRIFFSITITKVLFLNFGNFDLTISHIFFRFPLHRTLYDQANCFCFFFSNVSWIFFSVVLTKVLFWIFEILCLWFLMIFCWEFHVYDCSKKWCMEVTWEEMYTYILICILKEDTGNEN